MVEKQKRHTQIVTLLVILTIIGIALLVLAGIDYRKTNAREHAAATAKKEAIKSLYWHVKFEYEQLQNLIPWWNESVAKLTLNHTRDTVEHQPYTVAEFQQYHQGLIGTIESVKKNDIGLIDHELGALRNMFSKEYEVKTLMPFFKLRRRWLENEGQLDRLYYDIVTNTERTDSVVFRGSRGYRIFKPYFEQLEKMDRTLYELMAYKYQEAIQLLMHTYPEFVPEAKRILFGNQSYAVVTAYHAWKQDSIAPGNDMKFLPPQKEGDTLTVLSKIYRNGNKALVVAYTEGDIHPYTDEQRIAFVDRLDTATPKLKNEEKRYYCVWSEDGQYYATGTNKKLYPHVLEGDDREVMGFYDDELKRYYVTGEYDAFKAYYPGYQNQEPTASEVDK